MQDTKLTLQELWNTLYPELSNVLLDKFIEELSKFKNSLTIPTKDLNTSWYKEAVVYSLYVDLFNKDFQGLTEKLPYLQDLGVSCLWLLPVLDSPMKDAGFDISNYQKIRQDLLGNGGDEVFEDFLNEAHKKNIRVIFDTAMNHTSDQHEWFKQCALPE